jgi:hypothetical protein
MRKAKLANLGLLIAVLSLLTNMLAQSQSTVTPASSFAAVMVEKEKGYKGPEFFEAGEVPRWPLTRETQAYAAIKGEHLLEYVKELTEISHHSRDRGEQLWGRITGTGADAETAAWFAARLRQAGVTQVYEQQLELPEQREVRSWAVSVEANGKRIALESSVAARGAPGTNNAELDLEAVYVGLGSEADFKGRDVKGKAVFIYSMPLPGAWQQTYTRFDAAGRAEARGAAAIFVVIATPGNMRTVVGASTRVPGFTLGSQDGANVRELIEQAQDARPPHVRIRSDIGTATGEKTSLVWGVIPGMTDEKIVINAHRDGYYEAANDNATGVATALGLAEYFARIPKEKRRRTIIVVGNPGHHNTAVGSQFMVAHKDDFFAKAALLINCEHTAQARTDLFGNRLMALDVSWEANLYIGGGPKLRSLVERDLAMLGVSHYKELDPSPAGDIGQTYRLAPSLQLIVATHLYHTDQDTLESIPPNGLENVTRAYAKIIDDVNELELSEVAARQTGSDRQAPQARKSTTAQTP